MYTPLESQTTERGAPNQSDELDHIFYSIEEKRNVIDNKYHQVMNKLDTEESQLNLRKTDMIRERRYEMYEEEMQNVSRARERMIRHLKGEYTKLWMERDYLIQKEMDKILHRNNHHIEDFEAAFVEKRRNEQQHQIQLNNLTALLDETIPSQAGDLNCPSPEQYSFLEETNTKRPPPEAISVL